MQTQGFVVGFEYRACPRMEFSDIVEEFDLAFRFVDAQTRALIWDCDDIALIEREYVRVALGWLPPDDDSGSWHLVAAVGPIKGPNSARINPEAFRFVADQIEKRTQDFLPADSVLRGDAHQEVGPELIDSIFDLLRDSAQAPCDTTAPDARTDTRTDPSARAGEMMDEADIMDDDADIIDAVPVLPRAAAVQRWLTTRAEPTKPMRLTIHTLALTMMLYVPPVGAFMFAYTMLRDIVPMST
ncbi:hypothetical protein [Roseovarius sp.]|uniref:hypothetical protein n=1 Tax=Roseovarius sp. TaxID=1486281 RepID=UPI00356647C9